MPTPLLISGLGLEEEISGAPRRARSAEPAVLRCGAGGVASSRGGWQAQGSAPPHAAHCRPPVPAPHTAEAFRNCPLYVGGPVTKNLLHVLHGRRDVEGALEVIEGVFAGGVESASELVRAGEADAKEFMLLAGYSGWGPWQLAHELAGGTWLPIATSQPVIMDILKGGWVVVG